MHALFGRLFGRLVGRWTEAPVGASDGDRARDAQALYAHLIWVACGALAIAAFPIVAGDIGRRLTASAFMLGLTLMGALLAKRGHSRGASILVLGAVSLMLTALAVGAGGLRSPAFTGFFIVIIVAGVVLGWRESVIATAVALLVGFGLYAAEVTGHLPPVVRLDAINYLAAYTALLVMSVLPLAIGRNRLHNALLRVRTELGEREAAECAARASEAKLQAILDNTTSFLGLLDTDGRIVAANRLAREFLGASEKETASLSVLDTPWAARSPRTADWTKRAITRAATGETVQQELTRIGPSGEPHHFEVALRPVRDENGQIVSLLGEAREITRRRQAEDAFHAERAFATTILETIASLVVVLDPQHRIVGFNQACEKLSGYSTSQVEARQLDMLVPPDEIAGVRASIERLVREKSPGRHQNHWISSDGSRRLISWSNNVILDPDGKVDYIICTGQDVTDLDALSQMKDQFLGVAAHELKTPVTIMKGYAQTLLRSDAMLDTSSRRILTAIDRGADRIDHVVKDLLDISRLQAGQLDLEIEPLCLVELVGDVADRFSLLTPRHQISLDREVAGVAVLGDRFRLEQALANLIDNAIRYSPAGGDVVLTIGQSSNEATVAVRDEGVGIAHDKQSGVFERFYRAHTGTPYDYGGMGVGLYIAREIVGRHGGRMWFESVEGAGSTFHLALPLAN